MKNLLLSILIITIFPLSAFATQDTSLTELLSQSEVRAAEIEQLDIKEQERQRGFENQLGFSLPTYTDNPSYVLTFNDPSPDGKGVEIEIDGKAYVQITSPYTLPSLSIGQHTLKFRFYDKDGNVQVLEYNLIILPRVPIIKPPISDASSITVSGTGLSNSDILVFINSNTFNHTEITQTDNEGIWELKITPQEGVVNGIYTVTAYARKYGYASELSKPIVFEIGGDTNQVENQDLPEVFFSFASVNGGNISSVFLNNTDLIPLVLIPFVLGVLLTLLLKWLLVRNREERFERRAEAVINVNNRNGEKTLREIFESKSPEKDSKKTERVISKEDFLKDYKGIDPDDKNGKEKPAQKVKKNVKVTLTSHEDI